MATYSKYEYLKSAWIKSHPNATPQQYQQAMQKIARKLGI